MCDSHQPLNGADSADWFTDWRLKLAEGDWRVQIAEDQWSHPCSPDCIDPSHDQEYARIEIEALREEAE